MQNTKPGSARPDRFATHQSADHEGASHKIYDTAAALEARLQRETDDRKTERFFWSFIVTILLTPYLLHDVGAWLATLLVLLEVVFLIGLATWLGVDVVVVFLARIFDRVSLSKDRVTGAKPGPPAPHA